MICCSVARELIRLFNYFISSWGDATTTMSIGWYFVERCMATMEHVSEMCVFTTLVAKENGFQSKDLKDLRVQWRCRRNRKLQIEQALLDSRSSAEIWRDGWPSHCKIGPSGFLRDQPMPLRRRLIQQEEVWYLRNCDCAICYHRRQRQLEGTITQG